MRKTITYTSFLATTVIVVYMFVTAQNYTQLAVAMMLYPVAAFLGLNISRRLKNKSHEVSVSVSVQPTTKEETTTAEKEVAQEGVVDFDRRTFLKIIGAAGLSLFVFSILSKKSEVPFFGKVIGPSTTTLIDTEGNKINPAERMPLDGYQISEIDDNIVAYYGFINNNGAWFIMREDTDTSSFRYVKGDKHFPDSWSRREKLKYDYYHNVF